MTRSPGPAMLKRSRKLMCPKSSSAWSQMILITMLEPGLQRSSSIQALVTNIFSRAVATLKIKDLEQYRRSQLCCPFRS